MDDGCGRFPVLFFNFQIFFSVGSTSKELGGTIFELRANIWFNFYKNKLLAFYSGPINFDFSTQIFGKLDANAHKLCQFETFSSKCAAIWAQTERNWKNVIWLCKWRTIRSFPPSGALRSFRKTHTHTNRRKMKNWETAERESGRRSSAKRVDTAGTEFVFESPAVSVLRDLIWFE